MKVIMIPLQTSEGPTLSIIRACSTIVKNHVQEFELCKNDQCRQQLLKKLWKINYKSTFEDTRIVFNSENDKIMFILKWEL
jgi:hypothetical protein